MSVISTQMSIEWIQRDIEGLHRQLSDEAKKEADKSEAISRAHEAMGRASSASTVQSKQREIQSLERDRIASQKKRADLTKRISDKTRDLHRKQQELFKEQQREQKDALDAIKKREIEFRTDHDTKLRELLNRPGLGGSASLPSGDVKSYDAFISHATEDKEDLVRPLAARLLELGFAIWYDEFQLKVGDSLRRSIDRGLANSRFGIVVLSPSFFAKN